MSDPKQLLTSTEVNEQAPRAWREVAGALRTRIKVADYDAVMALFPKIASAADAAGHHPDLDVRYNWIGVTLVSHDVGGLTSRDIDLAGEISRIADDAGATLKPAVSAEMTVGIDTADASRIRPFWAALTGHKAKGDEGDLPSPDGQLPEIWFQDSEHREGRNRIHLDVYVPHDLAQERVDAAVAAGGRLVTDAFAPAWWVLADADGNEACVCTWQESAAT